MFLLKLQGYAAFINSSIHNFRLYLVSLLLLDLSRITLDETTAISEGKLDCGQIGVPPHSDCVSDGLRQPTFLLL
jgi:hypothetical protein